MNASLPAMGDGNSISAESVLMYASVHGYKDPQQNIALISLNIVTLKIVQLSDRYEMAAFAYFLLPVGSGWPGTISPRQRSGTGQSCGEIIDGCDG
jgi:hypothetical protein